MADGFLPGVEWAAIGPLCSRCKQVPPAPRDRYCRPCRAAYMREWRATVPHETPGAEVTDFTRSRSRTEAALDRAAEALRHARRIVVSAVRANAVAASERPEDNAAVQEIDRALADIETLRTLPQGVTE